MVTKDETKDDFILYHSAFLENPPGVEMRMDARECGRRSPPNRPRLLILTIWSGTAMIQPSTQSVSSFQLVGRWRNWQTQRT